MAIITRRLSPAGGPGRSRAARRRDHIDVVDAATHRSDWRFEFVEETATVPITKRDDLAEDLEVSEKQWDEGFAAIDNDDDHPIGRPAVNTILGVMLTGFSQWNRRQVLWGLYVDRQHRRRGIARALVDVAIARARDNGARQLWLETQSTNVTAIRAYQAMRFELIGFDDTLYDGSVAAETAMYFARAV